MQPVRIRGSGPTVVFGVVYCEHVSNARPPDPDTRPLAVPFPRGTSDCYAWDSVSCDFLVLPRSALAARHVRPATRSRAGGRWRRGSASSFRCTK